MLFGATSDATSGAPCNDMQKRTSRYSESQAPRTPCRPRQVIADAVKAGRRASWVRSRVHTHLGAVKKALPRGRVGAPVRGRQVAVIVLDALADAYRKRLADPEGSPLELLEWLSAHGVLDAKLPQRVAAEHALRLLADRTPLVVRTGRGRYRVLLRAYRDDEIHADRLAELQRLQTVADVALFCQRQSPSESPRCEPREPVFEAGGDPGAPDAVSVSDAPLIVDFSPETGPVLVCEAEQLDPSRARAAIQHQDVVRPVVRPSGHGRFSRSSWLQVASRGKHRHVRSLAELVLRHLPHVRTSGTPAEVVERLAQRDGRRLSSREKYRLARALLTLERRGLLVYRGDSWQLPEFERHRDLRRFDLPESPGCRAPTEALREWLARAGIATDGLSHAEAVALHGRVWSMRKAWTCPGTVLREEREIRRESLPVDLRESGDLAEARIRRRLEVASTEAPDRPRLTPTAPAPTVRAVSSKTWQTIVGAVQARWGGAAVFDLEARGGLVGEVLDLVKDADAHVLRAALEKALAGPAPRAKVGAVLAKNLREAIAEERRTLPTIERATGLDTPYMRMLAGLPMG